MMLSAVKVLVSLDDSYMESLKNLRVRDGTYYFSKHVPCDVKRHYRSKRIVMSLRTKSASRAYRACQSLLQRLEDYWLSLRLSDSPLP